MSSFDRNGRDDLSAHAHVDCIVMKLLPALETGNVGIPAVVAKLSKGGDRPREPPVAAAKQQVKHNVDHKVTLLGVSSGNSPLT